jgi:YD repeat-containing protein
MNKFSFILVDLRSLISRKIFSLLFSLVGISFYSHSQVRLQDILPKSPTSASLAKYSEVPVSLSNGSANFTIPIYNISYSDIDIPIYISYNNNGLKIADISSWVGLGFDVRAGGLISRQTMGLIDEGEGGIQKPQVKDYLNKYYNDPSWSASERKLFLYRAAKGEIDTQYDIFTFSFFGHSGSFYIDKDNIPRLMPAEPFKISYQLDGLSNIGSFTIIDDKGFKYEFGEAENTSVAVSTEYPATTSFSEMNMQGNTTWYLTKVTSPSNRVVRFFYQGNGVIEREMLSSILTLPLTSNDPSVCGSGRTYGTNGSIVQHTERTIRKIEFDHGYIEFGKGGIRQDLSFDRTAPDSYTLGEIKVCNVSNTVLQKYVFNYDYFSTNRRLKLKSIDVLGENLIKDGRYEFDYYAETEDFPSPHWSQYGYKAQDYWGYYNGQTSNKGLLPNLDYASIRPGFLIPIDQQVGNRNSDPAYAVWGMLKRVTYPTGGTVNFEYEGNRVFYANSSQLPPIFKYSPTDSKVTLLSDGTLNGYKRVTFTVATTSEISFRCNYRSNDLAGFNPPQIRIIGGPSAQALQNAIDAQRQCSMIENNTVSDCNSISNFCCIQPGHYTVELDAQPWDSYITSSVFIELQATPSQNRIVYTGGMRISKIRSCADANNCTEKRYEYDNVQYDARQLPVFYSDYLSNFTQRIVNAGSSGAYLSGMCTSYTIYDQPLNMSRDVEYTRVTEYFDDGSSGKKIYYFHKVDFEGSNTTEPYPVPLVKNWRSGLVQKEELYKAVGSNDYKILRRTINTYSRYYVHDGSVSSLISSNGLKVKFEKMGADDVGQYSTFNIGLTPLFSEFFHLSAIRRTDFSYTENNVLIDSLIKTTGYSYNNLHHLQPTKIETTSSDGEILIKELKYPQDSFSDLAGTAVQGKDGLIASNQVSLTLEERTLKDEVHVKSVRSNFKLNGDLVLLDNIEIKEDDASYEIRLELVSYDTYGNLLQQQLKKDVPKSYKWGYNHNFPIAEVVNATEGQIFYTSFEDDGILGDSKTGRRFLNSGSFSVPFTPTPSNKSYFMTYWYWLNDSWKFSGVLPFNINVLSPGTRIDELRVFPIGAQMNTYTYNEFAGITSKTDANNETVYYEYDGMQRLKVIRDASGNILTRISYKNKSGYPVGDYNYIKQVDVLIADQRTEGDIAALGYTNKNEFIEYFDGLGRDLQSVSRQGSPSGKDIVIPYYYDKVGRESIKYLPFVSSESSGSFKHNAISIDDSYHSSEHFNFYNSLTSFIENDSQPYSQTVFESSPLNRIVKQGAAGEAWQPDVAEENDKSIKNTYVFNAANEVLLFKYDAKSGDVLMNNLAYYSANQLYAHKTSDEHNHEVIAYTDKEGKTVLKKVEYKEENGTKLYAETYYIYDDFGNLVVVLPPEAVVSIKSSVSSN